MWDGVQLYVVVYMLKDVFVDNIYLIMLQCICYSVQFYGLDVFSECFDCFVELVNEKYIFVFQDVCGCWMSEGIFDNMCFYVLFKKSQD